MSDVLINIGPEAEKQIDNIVKKLELAIDTVKNLNKEFKNSSSPKELNKSIQNTTVALKKQNKTISEAERLRRNLVKTVEKNTIATSDNAKKLAEQREKLRQTNKENRLNARLNSDANKAYDRLSASLTKAEKKYRDLAARLGTSNKRTIRAQREVQKLRQRVDSINQPIKRFGDNVGFYSTAIPKATMFLKRFASAFGLFGGITLFVRGLQDGIKVLRDFEKTGATLSGVLQKSKEEISDLTNEAIRLGSTTVKTAQEVTQLQLAYARLGFSQEQIIQLTESTIQGSIALNSELDETAELVGAVVNTFDDFSAADAPKILDILALSTAKSALNFEKLQVGLPIVSGAANAAGVPFTKLVALLGKLSDAGIDVSTSSTALRNIFIESAAKGLSYSQILDKIKQNQDKLTTANDEFGKRAAVSATVLANAIDSTNELDEALQNAQGTSKEFAEKELNTLDGAIKLLSSAWEGFILQLNDASGAGGTLTKVIIFLANNLTAIFKTIGVVTGAWVAYKAVIIATNLITRIYTASTIALRIAKIALTGGITGATRAFKLFSAAIKVSPLGIFLTVLGAAVLAFMNLSKSAKEAREEIAKGTDEFIKQKKASEELNNKLELATSRYEELKSKTELTKEEQKELNDIILLIAKNIPDAVTEIDKYGDALEINTGKTEDFIKRQKEINGLETSIKLKENQEALKKVNKEISQFNNLGKTQKIIRVEGIGLVAKENGVLKEAVATGGKRNNLIISDNELTKEQQLLFKQTLQNLEKEKIAIQSRISLLDGTAEARAKALKEEEKARDEAEKQIRNIKNINAEISKLNETLQLSTTRAEAKVIQDKIKVLEAERDAILGIAEAKKDSISGDREALDEFRVKKQIEDLKRIADNQEESIDRRVKATNDLIEREETYIRIKKEAALADATNQEQRELIEETAAANLEALARETETRRTNIQRDALNQRQETLLKNVQEVATSIKAQEEKDLIDNEQRLLKGLQTQEEFEQNKNNIILNARKETLERQLELLSFELLAEAKTAEEKIEIEKKLNEIKKQLRATNIDIYKNEAKKQKDNIEEVEKAIERLKGQFASLAETFGVPQEAFNTIFDGIKDGFKSSEEAIDAFGAVAAGVFENITAAENARLERRLENIAKERDIAIQFAGDNVAAQEAINAQFQAKEAEIRKKQAQNEKKNAIFQIGVNTATAIIKTAAQLGFPAAIPFVAAVGAIGLAQAAFVASQPIPEFKDGVRNFEGGYAIVGDGGRREPITDIRGRLLGVSPDKPTLVDLPRGANVYSNMDEYQSIINPMGSAIYDNNRNVSVNVSNNGITEEQMSRVMNNVLGNVKQFNVNIDKNGVSSYLRSGGKKTTNFLNNRVTGKGMSV